MRFNRQEKGVIYFNGLAAAFALSGLGAKAVNYYINEVLPDSSESFHYGTRITYEGGGNFTVVPYEEVKTKAGKNSVIPEEYYIDWGDDTVEPAILLEPIKHEYPKNGLYEIKIKAVFVVNDTQKKVEVYSREVQVGPNDMLPQDGSVLGQPHYDEDETNPLCSDIVVVDSIDGMRTTVDFPDNFQNIGTYILGYGVNWGDGQYSWSEPLQSKLAQSHRFEPGFEKMTEPYAHFTLRDGTVVECELKEVEQK